MYSFIYAFSLYLFVLLPFGLPIGSAQCCLQDFFWFSCDKPYSLYSIALTPSLLLALLLFFASLGRLKFQQLSSPPWAVLPLFLLPLPSSLPSLISLSSLSWSRCVIESSRVLAWVFQHVLDSGLRPCSPHYPPHPHLWVSCVGWGDGKVSGRRDLKKQKHFTSSRRDLRLY